jgi:hypothetical protein
LDSSAIQKASVHHKYTNQQSVPMNYPSNEDVKHLLLFLFLRLYYDVIIALHYRIYICVISVKYYLYNVAMIATDFVTQCCVIV